MNLFIFFIVVTIIFDVNYIICEEPDQGESSIELTEGGNKLAISDDQNALHGEDIDMETTRVGKWNDGNKDKVVHLNADGTEHDDDDDDDDDDDNDDDNNNDDDNLNNRELYSSKDDQEWMLHSPAMPQSENQNNKSNKALALGAAAFGVGVGAVSGIGAMKAGEAIKKYMDKKEGKIPEEKTSELMEKVKKLEEQKMALQEKSKNANETVQKMEKNMELLHKIIKDKSNVTESDNINALRWAEGQDLNPFTDKVNQVPYRFVFKKKFSKDDNVIIDKPFDLLDKQHLKSAFNFIAQNHDSMDRHDLKEAVAIIIESSNNLPANLKDIGKAKSMGFHKIPKENKIVRLNERFSSYLSNQLVNVFENLKPKEGIKKPVKTPTK